MLCAFKNKAAVGASIKEATNIEQEPGMLEANEFETRQGLGVRRRESKQLVGAEGLTWQAKGKHQGT